MAKKVPMERMAATLEKMLKNYGESVDRDLKAINTKITKEGAKTLRQVSKEQFGGTGKYASGWTTTFETKRYSQQGTIYNKTVPGLPHLLEKPHAKRGGGRTTGNPHIAPVEERVAQAYERAVRNDI